MTKPLDFDRLLQVQEAGGVLENMTEDQFIRLTTVVSMADDPRMKELLPLLESYAKSRDALKSFLKKHDVNM